MTDASSGHMPDRYDRSLAAFTERPDVNHARPVIVRSVPPMGIGGTELFVVQTWRERPTEEGETNPLFTVFLEHTDSRGIVRLVLPPDVTKAIYAQRESLIGKARKAGARQGVATRKERGIVPGFLKARKTSKKGGER